MLSDAKWAEIARKYPWTDLGNGNLRSTIVRFSYVDLLDPRAYTNEKGESSAPRYGVTLLMPEGDDAALLKSCMSAALKNQFGESATVSESTGGAKPTVRVDYRGANGQPQRANPLWPLVDQAEVLSDGYVAGRLFIPAYSYDAIPVVDAKRQPVTDASSVYSGCYGFVTVRPYWTKTWGRLSIGLQGVQVLALGERLGGGVPAVDQQFEDVSGDFAGIAADMAASAAGGADAANLLG